MNWKDKLNEIVNGWGNVIFQSPEVEELANKRAEYCAKCPSNISNICGECGCVLTAKTRSTMDTNKCPLGKW